MCFFRASIVSFLLARIDFMDKECLIAFSRKQGKDSIAGDRCFSIFTGLKLATLHLTGS